MFQAPEELGTDRMLYWFAVACNIGRATPQPSGNGSMHGSQVTLPKVVVQHPVYKQASIQPVWSYLSNSSGRIL